jgi:NodT family efflux transporter outer membrane factor (OMF) lipoprotein
MNGHGLALACVALTALCGCQVGPDYATPTAPAVAGYLAGGPPTRTASVDVPAGQAQSFVRGLDVSGSWWALYGSAELNALMDRALSANPDLQAALAALHAARETEYAQRGAALPTVGVGYSAERQKVSDAISSPLNSNADLFTLHTLQLSVGYMPDVFGGLRRQSESAQAQTEAQLFQTEAAFLTLTANVVAAVVQQASLKAQIAETQAIIVAHRKALALLRARLRQGDIAGPDLAAEEGLAAQAEQTLPPLEKQLAQQNDLLAALTGRYPGEGPPPAIDLASLTLPAELPVSLPSRLVEQRPDVRAAAANLHVASAQVGVAIAARLPTFPLSANLGGQSTDIPSLLASRNAFWTLAAGVSQPIYQGGQLRRRQRAAEALLDEAKAQYRATVLAAFQNVADALQALDADARGLTAAAAIERSAAKSLASARTQLAAGETASDAVLSAEQTHGQARLALIQAQAARYADTAALFQALGGGWWNRTDIAQASPAPLGR